MVSFEVRPLLRAIKRLSAIAALGALSAGATEIASAEDALTRLADSILEAQAQGGPYAKELIEPLTHLSLVYEQRGDHASEAAALEQALQVVRANYGLRSLEQAPLIRQRIRGEEAVGNFAEAWELEQELLALARRHPGDVRTVPILHEIGDKRIELLRSYLAGERPPQLILGCYYEGPARPFDSPRNCEAGSRSGAARRMLLEAQRHYASAIAPLRGQLETASQELHELEEKLYRNSYLLGDYRTGRQSLVRRVFDDAANAGSPMSRIERLVELADWDLRAHRWTLAFDLYAEIYGYLEAQGAQARIEEIFSPVTPIVLPTFLPNLFAPDRAEGAAGYVDVAFDITEFGTRRIRVVGSHNASKAAEQRVQRWIVENHFRPRMTAGKFAEVSRVVARHYVHE
jgi:hypothetical protein